MAGNQVSISGFVTDAQAQGQPGVPGFLIYVDRVSDFSIHHNLARNGNGLGTRLASGTLEANLCIDNYPNPPPGGSGSPGIFISGGSMAHPASVALQRNRSTQNAGGASVFPVANLVQLNLGANTLMLEPLQMSYDINNPEDQQNIPDSLVATIEGNDFSDNTFFGLNCSLNPPFPYTTVDTTQPITGTLKVNIRNNGLNRNGHYGIIVMPAFANRSEPRQLTGTIEGTVENNALMDNGRNASVFSFTNWVASAGLPGFSRQDFKYVQQSTFQVTDRNGELAGFDYDHPLSDPFDGSPVVGNTLIYNDEVQPNGIKITPHP
jgi:hypothetical protein